MAIWSRRSANLKGLVHHSDRGVQYQDGYVGSLVSLSGDQFARPPGNCLADEGGVVDGGRSLPNGFLHVAGVSIIHDDLLLDWVYFGGSPEQKPGAWRRAEILSTTSAAIPTSW